MIYHRANSEKEYVGLQTWKDAPNGKFKKAITNTDDFALSLEEI